MRKIVSYGKNRYWLTVLMAVALPGVITAVIEYVITKGVSGEIPILAAASGGFITIFALQIVKVPEANETPKVPEANETPKVAELPKIEERIFSPRTPEELVASVQGLTEIAAEGVSRAILASG